MGAALQYIMLVIDEQRPSQVCATSFHWQAAYDEQTSLVWPRKRQRVTHASLFGLRSQSGELEHCACVKVSLALA